MVLWTARYDGFASGNDQAADMAVSREGTVYVTGASAGSSTNGSARYDFSTVKYFDVSPIALKTIAAPAGTFGLSFTNTPGATFTVMSATNPGTQSNVWIDVGSVSEVRPGEFQFVDGNPATSPQRYYRVRSP